MLHNGSFLYLSGRLEIPRVSPRVTLALTMIAYRASFHIGQPYLASYFTLHILIVLLLSLVEPLMLLYTLSLPSEIIPSQGT